MSESRFKALIESKFIQELAEKLLSIHVSPLILKIEELTATLLSREKEIGEHLSTVDAHKDALLEMSTAHDTAVEQAAKMAEDFRIQIEELKATHAEEIAALKLQVEDLTAAVETYKELAGHHADEAMKVKAELEETKTLLANERQDHSETQSALEDEVTGNMRAKKTIEETQAALSAETDAHNETKTALNKEVAAHIETLKSIPEENT